jgi:hypothetical protein
MPLHHAWKTFVILGMIGAVAGQVNVQDSNAPGELPSHEDSEPGAVASEADADAVPIFRPWDVGLEEMQEPQSAWAASRSLQAVKRRTPAVMVTSSLQAASVRNPSLDAPTVSPAPPSVPAGTHISGRYLVFFKDEVTDFEAGIKT